MSAKRPLIAIVGRPNVGKSTLFNRLVGRRRAIVEDTPGVTRDRHHADAAVFDRLVTFVDTGGFVPDASEDPLARHVRTQAQAAVEACDAVLFVVDGRAGASAGDEEVARYLRKQQRPLLLVVNKVDGLKDEDLLTADFHRLGLGEPHAVSAEHNNGIDALREALVAVLPGDGPRVEEPAPTPEEGEEALPEAAPARPVRLALVGRPNVGKSTLVNALLGEERVIVSPVAGTTRDPIDTALTYQGREVVLTDTAGIRRKAAVTQRFEHFSVLGALRAVEDSDVAVLVLDASEAGVDQDLKIAALAEEKGRGLVVAVNKWDLVKGTRKEQDFRDALKRTMGFVSWAPMVFLSAKEGLKVDKVLEVALQVADQLVFRAPTPMLNRVLEHITTEHPLPTAKGRQLRLYYVAQVSAAPPGFAFVCNMPEAVPDRYKRYVANYLRSTFGLKVPLRLYWRERPGKAKRRDVAKRFEARAASKRRR